MAKGYKGKNIRIIIDTIKEKYESELKFNIWVYNTSEEDKI